MSACRPVRIVADARALRLDGSFGLELRSLRLASAPCLLCSLGGQGIDFAGITTLESPGFDRRRRAVQDRRAVVVAIKGRAVGTIRVSWRMRAGNRRGSQRRARRPDSSGSSRSNRSQDRQSTLPDHAQGAAASGREVSREAWQRRGRGANVVTRHLRRRTCLISTIPTSATP